jgi:hypothetical protein
MISSDHHRIWQLWSSVVTLKREILEELGMQNCSVSSKHRSMHWVCTNEYYLHSISRKAIAYSKNGWITLWKYEQGIRGQGAETLNRPTWVGGDWVSGRTSCWGEKSILLFLTFSAFRISICLLPFLPAPSLPSRLFSYLIGFKFTDRFLTFTTLLETYEIWNHG